MKTRYKILGTQVLGNNVRLLIQPNSIVEEKETLNPVEMSENFDLTGLLEKTQNIVMKKTMVDSVTISYVEWEKHKYKIGDVVWVDVTPGDEG